MHVLVEGRAKKKGKVDVLCDRRTDGRKGDK